MSLCCWNPTKWNLNSMGAKAHLGALGNCSLHDFHFCLCQNRGIINLIDQVIFLIIGMRTILLLSLSLVHNQRSSQFSNCFGSQSVLTFSGCLFSRASLLFNLMQFPLKWLVSLQYWWDSSGLRDPSIPRASYEGLVFPRYGLPV